MFRRLAADERPTNGIIKQAEGEILTVSPKARHAAGKARHAEQASLTCLICSRAHVANMTVPRDLLFEVGLAKKVCTLRQTIVQT